MPIHRLPLTPWEPDTLNLVSVSWNGANTKFWVDGTNSTRLAQNVVPLWTFFTPSWKRGLARWTSKSLWKKSIKAVRSCELVFRRPHDHIVVVVSPKQFLFSDDVGKGIQLLLIKHYVTSLISPLNFNPSTFSNYILDTQIKSISVWLPHFWKTYLR